MKVNNINDVVTIPLNPYQALRNPRIRYTHYMRNFLDTPEQFLVCYQGGSLIFSNMLSEDEIIKYDKLFRNYAKAKYLDSRGQETRMKEISKKFGKQGITAATKFFEEFHKDKQTRKRQSKDYFSFCLSAEDRERLYAAQESSGENNLTENQFARLLLEKELQRLYPDAPAQNDRRAEP